MRKFVMSYKHTNLIPADYFKLSLKHVCPRWGFTCAFGWVWLNWFSDTYDKAFDTSKLTKYIFIGCLAGGMLGKYLGSYGFAKSYFFFGGLIGSILSYKDSVFYNFDRKVNETEYLTYLQPSEEEKRKWRLQEHRLTNYTQWLLIILT